MTFRGKKLSDPSVRDVLLADVTDPDYLYFVDDETGETKRIRVSVLKSALRAAIFLQPPYFAQALSYSMTGVTPEVVGALYLPAGTILAGESRALLGNASIGDDTTLEIRSADGSLIGSVSNTGVLADAPIATDIVIETAGWYTLQLFSSAATVATILGLHLRVEI